MSQTKKKKPFKIIPHFASSPCVGANVNERMRLTIVRQK